MNNSQQDTQKVQIQLYTKFFHGLSNPTRFRIVEILLDGEKTVSELVELLDVSQSQVSNQLNCLKWCNYVSSRKEGKHMYYQVTDVRIRTILELGKEVVNENASFINSCTRM